MFANETQSNIFSEKHNMLSLMFITFAYIGYLANSYECASQGVIDTACKALFNVLSGMRRLPTPHQGLKPHR